MKTALRLVDGEPFFRVIIIGQGDRMVSNNCALAKELVETVVRMGYPEEFGHAIVQNLRTEKTMSRMIGYLKHAKPRSAEEIADEMLAIMEDRKRWIQKKEAEYYNSKYNEILYFGLGVDEEE